MGKKAFKKAQESENNETYVIDIEDWKASCAFQPNDIPMKLLHVRDSKESPTTTLLGKIISPTLENVSKVKIEIKECPDLDDHRDPEKMDDSLQSIGSITVLKDNTLCMKCSVPSRLVQYILVAFIADKITQALVLGTKLERNKGEILGIDLATQSEDN